eukprot:jgi/Mesvir1/994/Mv17534-RA.1
MAALVGPRVSTSLTAGLNGAGLLKSRHSAAASTHRPQHQWARKIGHGKSVLGVQCRGETLAGSVFTNDKTASVVQPSPGETALDLAKKSLLALASSATIFAQPQLVPPAFAAEELQPVEAQTFSRPTSSGDLFPSLTAPNPLFSIAAEGRVCEEPYGLLPCSTSVGGSFFLMVAFGYILFMSAQMISEGSELLLEVLDPGLIGGLLLPLLGAFPDAALIAVSGLSGTVEQAQEEVLVGVGVLAGSTVMILTVAWAGAVIAGRCDLDGPGGTAVDLKLTHGFDLQRTGVTTDEQTKVGALIMMATCLPYLLIQIPVITGHIVDEQGHLFAGLASAVAIAGLIGYSAYQVSSPWLQQKKIEEARLRLIRSKTLRGLDALVMGKSWGSLTNSDGSLNQQATAMLFDAFDRDRNGTLERSEVAALVTALAMDSPTGVCPLEEEVATWLSEFDTNKDGLIDKTEFSIGMVKWVESMKKKELGYLAGMAVPQLAGAGVAAAATVGGSSSMAPLWTQGIQESSALLELLLAEAEEEEEGEGEGHEEELSSSAIIKKAALLLVAGTAIVTFFADPVINTVGDFSAASGIPPFFVAFIAMPLASNSSELVASFLFARKRRKRNMSLTMSSIYGAITMNNTLCLGVFLWIVYMRGLVWNYSSEVLVTVAAALAVGSLGVGRTTFPLWMSLAVLLIYPAAVGGVAFLDNALGWQ